LLNQVSILYFIAIFEIIVALLLMCSILLYVKRIIVYSREYGRSAFVLGLVFIGSNIFAGSFNFYIGGMKLTDYLSLKSETPGLWCLMFIPYYILTEFLPAAIFAITMFKYGEIPQNQANNDQVDV